MTWRLAGTGPLLRLAFALTLCSSETGTQEAPVELFLCDLRPRARYVLPYMTVIGFEGSIWPGRLQGAWLPLESARSALLAQIERGIDAEIEALEPNAERARLLDRLAGRGRLTIDRHGVPVARQVPVGVRPRRVTNTWSRQMPS